MAPSLKDTSFLPEARFLFYCHFAMGHLFVGFSVWVDRIMGYTIPGISSEPKLLTTPEYLGLGVVASSPCMDFRRVLR